MPAPTSVIPITVSTIAWTDFLKGTLQVTGRSPIRSIDASGFTLSDYAKYIIALNELRHKEVSNPVDTLRDAGSLLQHIHFSFLIGGSSGLIFKICELTPLNVLSTCIKKGRFALVSGTLGEWKDAITELSKSKSSEAQWVVETLLGFFSSFGLKHVFTNLTLRLK
ncbi:MAG: hypothetical protein V3V68_05260 [Nitrosomonadaceae bacterium]